MTPQGWTAGPAPETSAWTAGPMPRADFRTSNETDDQGNPVVRGASSAWDVLNTPLDGRLIGAAAHAIARHIDAPSIGDAVTNDKLPGLGTLSAMLRGGVAGVVEGAGEMADSFTSPIGIALTLAQLGPEGEIVKRIPALKGLLELPAVKSLQRAVQATSGAGFMAHGGSRVLNAPDAAGKLQGVAEMAAGALGATSAVRGARAPTPVSARLSPEEAASNAFAEQRGIPLDAATATGSRFVRGVQKTSGESLFGAPAAERAQAGQAAGLTRVGNELADQARPAPTTPEVAGQEIANALGSRVDAHGAMEQAAYGKVEAAATQRGLTVPTAPIKAALKPLYDALTREAQLTPAAMMGGKAQALNAIDRLMQAPADVPLMDAERALGALKGFSRLKEGQLEAMRTPGQGAAAVAVKQLQKAVDTAAIRGGVLRDLQTGRAATVAKYETNGVLETLSGQEPAGFFRQVTRPKDAAIGLLRSITQQAPQVAPQIARGYLEDLLGQATERGRFDHADKLYAEWQKLGSETKQILFPQPGQRQALDHFFLLAKRIAENPNPSGTAPTLLKTGEVVGIATHPIAALPGSLTLGAVSKLLYTPAGVRALTRFMAQTATRTSPGTLRSAAQTAGWAEVVAAARAAGVPLGVPATAGPTDRGDSRR